MKKVILLSMAAIMLSSCATISTGFTGRQTVSISSEPNNATICVVKKGETFPVGNTPSTLSVKRNTKLIILKKEGYRDTIMYSRKSKIKTYDEKTGMFRKVPVKYHAKTNWWMACNLIYGGIIGIALDAATGSIYRMSGTMSINMSPIVAKDKKTEEIKKSSNTSIPSNKIDKLKELKALLDEKLITQDDYEKEKKKILEE